MSEESDEDYFIYNQCPKCGSQDIAREQMREYTGGGYADFWEEYECNNCNHLWRGNKIHGYS